MIKEYLERFAAKNRAGNLPYKNRRLGIALKIISGVTVVAIFLPAGYLAFTYGDIPAILFLFVGFLIFSPIIGLWDYGESMLAQRGEDLLKAVKQGFVLFLRSFDKEDSLTNEWETKLIDILDVGKRSIAIGKPNELFQTLGAPRVYYTDDDWKSQAVELIEKSNLVVIRIGKTQGLLWEVSEAISKCAPEKLLLFHPFRPHFDYADEEEYNFFVKSTAALFIKPIPPFPRMAKYAILIGFKADGQPYLLEPEGRYRFFEKIFGGDEDWKLEDLYFLSVTQNLREQLHNKKDTRLYWECYSVVSRFNKVILLVVIAIGLVAFLIWTLITKLGGF
jgi:hypothetical protein